MVFAPSELLISYRGMEHVVAAGLEAVSSAPLRVKADAVEDAAMVAGIEAALILLKQTENDPRARGGAAVFLSVDHRPASLLQSFMAEQAASGKGTYESLESGGFEAKFDEKDAVGWALSLRAWWRRCMDKHAFRPPSSEPENVGRNDFRVALLGDWGTGLYGAPVCSSSIRKTKYDVLLHLGDDYYAGTEPEVEGRFLKVWPDVSGAISRAINSNHEMYSGGNAYFRQTLAAFHQSSSLFALRSNHWLLIGLDSAYEGNDRSGGRLSDMQIGWVTTLVNDAVANGQRVILFSHHQPFSLYDNQGSVLATCIEGVLNSRRVFAWYWGHEHRCVIFERHPQWQLFGRCIGHSGFPYFRDIFPGALHPEMNPDGSRWITLVARKTAPTGKVLDGPNPYIKGHEEEYGPNGYATLEFSDQHMNETIHAPDGTVLFEHQLV